MTAERFYRDESIDSPQEHLFEPQNKPEYAIFYDCLHYNDLRVSGLLKYPSVTLPDTPLNAMATQYAESEVPRHTVMSMSDFELACTPLEKLTTHISEAEAKGAICGVAGHKITYLVTELTKQLRQGIHPVSVSAMQTDLSDEEKSTLETVAKGVLDDYKKIYIQDVPLIAGLIWHQVRDHYTSVKKIPNSTRKALIEGSQYSSSWVGDYWNSDEVYAFEQSVLELHEGKIRRFLNQQPHGTEEMHMPLESHPRFETGIEKPLVKHADLGAFRIQFRGQADFVLKHNSHDYVIGIDAKFGNPDKLYSLPNRLQALLYSHAIGQRQFSKKNYDEVTVNETMFIYEVFDTKNYPGSIFYKDASVYPKEYPALMQQLYEACLKWWIYQKDYREVKYARKNAIVMPHFALPEEKTRPLQQSMYF